MSPTVILAPPLSHCAPTNLRHHARRNARCPRLSHRTLSNSMPAPLLQRTGRLQQPQSQGMMMRGCHQLPLNHKQQRQLMSRQRAGVRLAATHHTRQAAVPSQTAAATSTQQRHHRQQQHQQQLSIVPKAAQSTAPQLSTQQQPPEQEQLRGKAVVMAFYEAYNRRDLDTIQGLIADSIVYSDLVYEEPHEGREGVMEWLEKIRKYAPDDLKFVIEDITDGDDDKVGVMWHVECGDGIEFPFSRGCSFITLSDGGRKIQTVRDIVEPAMKPGDSTLQLLGTLTPLIRKLGPGGADPSRLKTLPIASAAVWALYAGYLSVVMFSTAVPGAVAWAQPPEVFDELFKESINIWWINEALANLGLSPIPSAPCNPVSEAVFNFVLAWAGLFLPVLLTDGPSQKVEKKGLWFTGIMFLTNVFFIPFMALRAQPEPLLLEPAQPAAAAAAAAAAGGGSSGGSSSSPDSSSSSSKKLRQRKVAVPGSQELPGWAPIVGAAGGFLGAFSIYWALAGRPELGGDLAARWTYLQATFNSNRVFWAFWLDMVLFYHFQLTLLQAAPAKFKYLPFFGMVGWLLVGGTKSQEGNGSATSSSS